MTATEVSRNSASVLDRAEHGETVVLTRGGRRPATLAPALRRDDRAVERKKAGPKKARKAPRYSERQGLSGSGRLGGAVRRRPTRAGSGACGCKAEEDARAEPRQPTTTPQKRVPNPATPK
ncbi:antitoxin (DNA-binding transcriptional repressor) of toxin-antitoxin stability system [Streptomyces sp. B3I7]|nr:antitoxin (DNA-binding transcriptional repressor) of toxin-antitoxin stability system [Streptomyces sp. B3I7]